MNIKPNSNANKDAVLSLMEPARLITDWFREKVIQQMLVSSRVIPSQSMLNYDSSEVLIALLKDIFLNDYGCDVNYNTCDNAIAVLMKDGLEKREATKLARQVLGIVVNIILTFKPDSKLISSEEYRYAIVDDYDLFISRPYKDDY